MLTLYEKKSEAMRMIVDSLRNIDNYNLSNDDAKMMSKDLFIKEIMSEFDVGKGIASKWLDEALVYNKSAHECILKQESAIRLKEHDRL